MIDAARARGLASERILQVTSEVMEGVLVRLADLDQEGYWDCMREVHEVMCGPHYNEMWAERDVRGLEYTDRSGKRMRGAHWTKEEVRAVMSGKVFGQGVTECDKWVAANVMYADLGRVMDEGDVIEAAFAFFFADEDSEDGKIWRYMRYV